MVPAVAVLALALGILAYALSRRGGAASEPDDSAVLPSGASQSNKVRRGGVPEAPASARALACVLAVWRTGLRCLARGAWHSMQSAGPSSSPRCAWRCSSALWQLCWQRRGRPAVQQPCSGRAVANSRTRTAMHDLLSIRLLNR